MTLTTTITLAYQSILSNKLRTLITVAIITFGLTALIGILTSIEAMKVKMKDSFSFMGTNSFRIVAKEKKINIGKQEASLVRKDAFYKNRTVIPITYTEAALFKKNYAFPSIVSITHSSTMLTTVTYGALKTNPNVNATFVDEHYLTVNGFGLASGRNLTVMECTDNNKVCILGNDVVKALFGNNGNTCLQQQITIQGIPYTIIGTLKPKGAASFFSFDNAVLLPVKAAETYYGKGNSYTIGVQVQDVQSMPAAIDDSKSILSIIRNTATTGTINVGIEKSDKLADVFITATNTITFAAIAIGLITVLGAAIGLMNIMLVTVNERTKEVGLIKAIGGTNADIKKQLITETVLITILGAIGGVVLGVLIGNIVGAYLQVPFVLPLQWIMLGIILCTSSGLLASLYPAYKAAALNPIEALRYE